MKKYNVLKTVGISILVTLLLTWIFPIGYVQEGGYVEAARETLGLFDFFSYFGEILSYFSYVVLIGIAVAIFYGVLRETGVYGKLVDKVKYWKNNEFWFFVIIVFLLSGFISATGEILLSLLFIPVIVALVLKLGYSRKVAGLLTVGSIATGVIGTTIGMGLTGGAKYFLTDLTTHSNLLYKLGLFLASNMILLFFIKELMEKEGKVKDKEKDYFIPSVEKNKKSLVPLYVVSGLMLLVLMLGLLPWSDLGLTVFNDALNAINEFELFGFAIFAKLLGNVNAFGAWSVREATTVILVVSTILGLVYKVKLNDAIKSILKGLKKAAYPVLIMTSLYLVLVIVTYHPFQGYIYYQLLNLTNGFNVLLTSLVALLSGLLNVEMPYAMQSSLTIFTEIFTDGKVHGVVELIYQAMFSVVVLVAPTSVILMGTLSYIGVSYKEWLKVVWKVVLGLLLLGLAVSTLLLLI